MGNQKSESDDDGGCCCILLPFPFLALVTVILFSIALFCPNTPTLNSVSQITISPSTELQPRTQAPTTRPDGPTVWFGIFGEIHTEMLLPLNYIHHRILRAEQQGGRPHLHQYGL